jgi:lipid A 4'-phosphatase
MEMLRRDWIPEGILLAAVAVVVTVVFAVTPLDIAAARVFFRPDGADHWPLAKQFPWSFLYALASPITGSLIVLGLVGLVAGHVRGREAWRANSVFLILSVVIGPGLVINAVFKDHWDRPRPRDVVEFGGPMHCTPPPLRGEGGESFPCGHCSVGFLYASGWWLWKRRRPGWARASLALGLAAGFALGLGRMAAGGHFLSDVIWSALIALGLAHALYYYILRIPVCESRPPSASGARPSRHPRQRTLIVLGALVGAAAVLLALFATPHGRLFATNVDFASLLPPPRVLEVTARTANIEIVIGDSPARQMLVTGELHGFGLPASRLDAVAEFHPEPVPTLSYRIEQRGWITDLDASATIHVPPGELQRIVVRLQRGSIRVIDNTQSRAVNNGTLQLDLRTKAGHVQQPDR